MFYTLFQVILGVSTLFQVVFRVSTVLLVFLGGVLLVSTSPKNSNGLDNAPSLKYCYKVPQSRFQILQTRSVSLSACVFQGLLVFQVSLCSFNGFSFQVPSASILAPLSVQKRLMVSPPRPMMAPMRDEGT